MSLTTLFLFILSVFIHINENRRGTDLLTGSDYIKGLDVSKVHQIQLSFKDNKKLTLTRDSNRFVLENHKSFPASTSKVNDLIYKIASIQVDEKVGTDFDEDKLKKLNLDNSSFKYKIELRDNDGKKVVSFKVGKSHKGKGNYLLKDNQRDVYLSKDTLWLNSSYKDFISTVLLQVKKDDIHKITLKSDKKIELINKNEELVPIDDKAEGYKKDNIKEFTSNLSNVKFEEFFNVTEPKVQGLKFDDNIEIQLKNKLIYKMSLAKEDKEHFVRLSALLDDTKTQFVVKQNDGIEELKKIEDSINAQSEVQFVNMNRAAWVYKIDKATYDNLVKKSTYFF